MGSSSIPRKVLKIAARQSDLARLQAESVGRALQLNYPELKIEFHFRASLGDQNQNDPLWKMPEKGVFTEDFYRDLVDEKVDLVVHSWKDLPIESKAETEIFATLAREDQRDLFLLNRENFARVKASREMKVLTSSPRRSYNLETFFKNYFPCEIKQTHFLNVRGNILTRLKKLFSEDADGLILAKAALDRLLASKDPQYVSAQNEIRKILKGCQWMCLPLTLNPSAAAQGALAIEAKKNTIWKEVLASIQDRQCFESVQKERQILQKYGGGCHQKIGVSVLPRSYGELCFLRGLTDRGEVLDSVALSSGTTFEKARSMAHIFPQAKDSGQFFDRIKLNGSHIDSAVKDPFIWIAKEDAAPEKSSFSGLQTIWTSGLKTWRKLAQRGIWVNGSAESLGENEAPRIEALLEQDPIKWTKLTHLEGFQNPDMKVVATYELLARESKQNLKGVTHFYWSSGSAFDLIYQAHPEMKTSWHFCGPGHSYEHIKMRLGSEAQLRICLSFEDWLEKVL